jgi:hypothetical protein
LVKANFWQTFFHIMIRIAKPTRWVGQHFLRNNYDFGICSNPKMAA